MLVDKHGTTLEPCSGYCHMPVKFLGKHWGDLANKTYAADKADLPIKPIGSTPKTAMV
ncbi:MAG: hypothetical protein HZA02_05910 [Nitrospinae bacterium]|nr:hypothetical protein [Nitrospinota bacterium]